MKLRASGGSEFQRFNNVIDKLISVSHDELKRRLKAEEKVKEKRKAAKPSAASRASGEDI